MQVFESCLGTKDRGWTLGRTKTSLGHSLGHASNCPDLSQSMWAHPPHCYICMTLAGLLASFLPPAPDAGRHLLPLLREESSRSTLQASFRQLIWNRPLPANSRLSNSLAIPRDHWLQTGPHENLKGIPALQKHPEKCQPVLSLPGLPAAWVSACWVLQCRNLLLWGRVELG